MFYFTQDIDLDYSVYTRSLSNEFIIASAGLQPLIDAINGVSALTGGLIQPLATPAPAGTGFDHVAIQDHENYAVFGQFDYKLNDELTLTAGLRFTSENKELNTVFTEVGPGINGLDPNPANWADPVAATGVLTGLATGVIDLTTPEGLAQLAVFTPFSQPGWAFPLLAAQTQPRLPIIASLDDDQVTGTIKLSYQPDSDTLYYASYGTGFKSGGTNTDRIAAGFDPVFDAEKSRAFELGMKKDLDKHDLRINAAIHSTEVTDFQALSYTGTGFNLQNAGSLDLWGAELEAIWLPTDELQIDLRFTWIDSNYGSFENGTCWVATPWHFGIDDPGRRNPTDPFCDRSGEDRGTENYNATLKVKYDLDLFDNTYSYVQVDTIFYDGLYLDQGLEPLSKQDAKQGINARLFIGFEEHELDLIFWGRNIFDEDISMGLTNAPLQEGKYLGYLAEPATYGITLKKHF